MAGDGLYLAASQIINKVSSGQGAIRTLCYSSTIQNKKALYGLVLETAKHLHLLRRIVEQSGWLELANKNKKVLPKNVKRVDPLLAAVLLQDFLFSSLKCGPELKSLVEGSKARLRAELVRAQIHFKRTGQVEGISADSEEDQVPRYVRVNRCLVPPEKETDELIKSLQEYTKLLFPTNFYWDQHVKDLLVFPPGTDFSKCPDYKENKIILQDKASCFPPQVLQPRPGAFVIDACAAPGNKTSQLCALVGSSGHVFAFERDSRRFQTLQKLTSQALGPTAANYLTCQHADFLAINPTDPKYAKVEYILCDPSCSGSGMPMSLERSLSKENSVNVNVDVDDQSDHRLIQLSRFQIKILKHAASFPSLHRLVYSTCSIHAQENEMVVQEILKTCPHLKIVEGILPGWHRRGQEEFEFGKDVVRASAKEDQMNGFFVALFERIIK
jgi:25S rRNA (cytosine2278-C5)-methyltransferase